MKYLKRSFTSGMVLLTVILMDLLTGMEFDLFVPSFPELQSQFNLTPFWVETLLSVNFLGYCASLFIVGSLADRYGRKPILLWGLLTFVAGSTLCVFALSYQLLILGRLLQGIGIASPAILSFLMIADAYPLKQQQFYIAMLNGVKNLSIAVSPVVGSYITLNYHWQGNFLTLLILGLVTLFMGILFAPNRALPINECGSDVGSYRALLKCRPLMLLMIHIIFMFIPYWVFVGMSPLLYLKDLGVSLNHFGYYQGAHALVFALGSICFGFKIAQYNSQKILTFSGLLYVISFASVVIASLFNTNNPLFITLSILPFIISQIIPSTMLVPICLNFLPESKAKISAVLQGAQLLFVSISLQLAGFCYRGSFQNIGLIISGIIALVLITHFLLLKNKKDLIT